jgi:hypothetical protein
MSTSIENLPYTSSSGQYQPTTDSALPPQHVPQQTLPHVADKQTLPAYMPPKPQPYIQDQPQTSSPSSYEMMIVEYKMPILAIIAYFIFSLDTVRLTLKATAPTTFVDGTAGMLAYSLCFGALFYTLSTMLEMITK